VGATDRLRPWSNKTAKKLLGRRALLPREPEQLPGPPAERRARICKDGPKRRRRG
jgi:hypothetical protein